MTSQAAANINPWQDWPNCDHGIPLGYYCSECWERWLEEQARDNECACTMHYDGNGVYERTCDACAKASATEEIPF